MKIDFGGLAAISAVIMTMLGVLGAWTRKLYQAATPEEVKKVVDEGIAGTKQVVDERHTELQRRLSNQDGALLRIEDLIRSNDQDNRRARHDLRDSVQAVGTKVAVVERRVEHIETTQSEQAKKLEELAIKVEKGHGTTVNVLGSDMR
jgi:uncharacterized coiled-coil protein SlyX